VSEPSPPDGTDGMTSGGTGFLGAVQFLTRIPVHLRRPPSTIRSVPWFPVVGALVGALCGAVAAGAAELVPASVAAVLAIAAGLLVTGAFHEDGLADTADALGGWTPAQRREIMKDSRHGTYGVAAMTTSIVLRVLCVAALGPAAAVAGLIAAHTLGRGAAVAVAGWAPSDHAGRGDGLGADHVGATSPSMATTTAIVAVAIAAAATGWWVGPLALVTGVGAGVLAVFARRAFERIDGDVLGAVEQVGECAVLVVVTALAAHHSVWWSGS